MSVNKVILVGNVGRDPETRYSSSGSAVTNLSVATSRKWTKDGERKEETEWHRVVMYGKLAEIAGQYLGKGKMIYIEGRLQTRKWQDKDGADRYTTEIVAEQMQMLGGKGEQVERAPDNDKPKPQPARRQSAPDFDDMDEPPF